MFLYYRLSAAKLTIINNEENDETGKFLALVFYKQLKRLWKTAFRSD